MAQQRIVAIGLLTQEELTSLGPAFNRAWPLDETPCFTGLLEAIDEAERELWQERDASRRSRSLASGSDSDGRKGS